ncbi:hypothetical protein [Streptomyces sp. NBC_01794]|uniref:hypothetical protein n=1 Tax=Streptomyces sp. NBC_01794 TaxID=2975942 RepID=UPI0030847783|nr:hypothetical protein OIE54_23440 [Streptomyces sp. NBC_01794]
MRHIEALVHDRLRDIDIAAWQDVPAEQFADRPELIARYLEDAPHEAAARALKYARSAGSLSYDDIGFRSLSVTPFQGQVPFKSFAQARADAQRQQRWRTPELLETLLEQQPKLRHRPLSVPDGRWAHETSENLFNMVQKAEHGEPEDGIVWSFPLSAPPRMFLDGAQDRELPQLLSQYARYDLADGRRPNWLPLPALIGVGHFVRCQQWRASLVSETLPGHYYLFLSHRWLTPTAPDPDGLQARLAAWQLVSAMCEAVYVARERGLHTPRKYSQIVSGAVGAAGSDLAESLLVNVLRKALDPSALGDVYEEVLPLQEVTADNGVRMARSDIGLARLRELVGDRPLLGGLLARVHVWYDYSCVPQPPRTAEEQEEFEFAMGHFGLLQALGRTAVLLDDADDYLSRAWCTLEVLTADALQNFDVLVGADRPTVVNGRTEHHLSMLLEDRPHVVWRAVLDTEVFRVQTPADCMRRLELAATDEADLPAIYQGLCRLGAPRKIHIDGSEVVTGTFPLPVVQHGRTIVLPTTTERLVGEPQPTQTTTLDWASATSVDWIPAAEPLTTESHVVLERRRWRSSCHVAVVGACEGEAVLLANWIVSRKDELKHAVGVPVGSLTWLATDVAPVGHFAEGTLRTAHVDAPLWVLVASDVRFLQCQVVRGLLTALRAARMPFVTLTIDVPEDNVMRFAPTDGGKNGDADAVVRVAARQARSAAWRGGLFRDQLLEELRWATSGARR